MAGALTWTKSNFNPALHLHVQCIHTYNVHVNVHVQCTYQSGLGVILHGVPLTSRSTGARGISVGNVHCTLHMCIQWNLSNLDTLGTEGVLISEVS